MKEKIRVTVRIPHEGEYPTQDDYRVAIGNLESKFGVHFKAEENELINYNPHQQIYLSYVTFVEEREETSKEQKEKAQEQPKSLRDEFAMAALSGIIDISPIAWRSDEEYDFPEEVIKSITSDAYKMADAMMEARKQ